MLATMRLTLPIAAAASIIAASPAPAADVMVSGWARAGIGNAAAYVTVHNHGRSADRLLSVSTPAAAMASVHDSLLVRGVATMRPAGPLVIAPGQSLAMAPGGKHIMLMGLKGPLRPGTRLPLTLRFAGAGTVTVTVPVLPPGAIGPAEAHRGH